MNVYELVARLRDDRSLLQAELAAIDRAIERCEERFRHSYMTDSEVGRLRMGDRVHRVWHGACVEYAVNLVATKGNSHEAFAAYRGPGGPSVIRITNGRTDVHTPDRCPAHALGQDLAEVVSLRAVRARRTVRRRQGSAE